MNTKNYPSTVARQAEKREQIFRSNPFAPTLKTHRLKGKFAGFWSFSISYKYRIVFEFHSKEVIYFHATGDHRVYQ